MKRSTRILGGILLASLLAMAFAGTAPIQTARAAPITYTVNLTTDSGDGTCDAGSCTLRDAILNANANLGDDTIIFNPGLTGSIALVSSLPNIAENLVIDGAGAKIAITGNNFRILTINSGIIVTLNALTFQNGKDTLLGGGIHNSGALTVTNSTFIGNQAIAGGGIANFGSLTIANSAFSANIATGYGGGVYNEAGTLTIFNSAFSANSAPANSGGAVYNKLGATLNYANTILANSSGGDCFNAGSISTNSHNLVEDASCSAGLNSDPLLDALADNGGPTRTFKLLAGSPAIDAGDDATCAASPVNNLDQRGVTRPLGPHCDIGSYEAAFVPVISLSPSALNFGEQAVGTTSAAKDVVLTYTGSGSVVIGALSVSGEFALASNLCNDQTLATSQQCSFSVTFSPTSNGAKTGTVTIPDNTATTLASLTLSGTGATPLVGLSATSLTFAPQYVETTSATQTVTVTNIGAGTLKIGTVRISGDFILHTNRCNGASLPANGTCKFGVAFSPITSGTRTGAVSMPSNAATSPNRIKLRGTTKAGTQLLKMGNFDLVTQPIPWVVNSPDAKLVRLRDCTVFLSPLCSAKFIGSRRNPTLSAVQLVTHNGAAGDKFYIALSSRANSVPAGGQYKLIVSFYNGNGLVASKTLLFSNGSHGFQTMSLNYTIPSAYTRILFNFTYQKTDGVAWFDNAMLILLP